MPAERTFYQRIFHQDLFLSPTSHQARSAIMPRHCSNRVCLIMCFLLFTYIGWYIIISPIVMARFQYDSIEHLAYIQAMNKSLPVIQNTQICSLDEVDLLFIIISSNSHFLERQAIRETWGSMPDLFGVHSQRLFVIGYHPEGHFYGELLNEAKHEQDLLYLTVDDHLDTHKELQAYRWLEQHCSHVKYIFKTEDDIFLNSLLLHELVRELKTKSNVEKRNLYNAPLDSLFLVQTAPDPNKFLFGWAYAPVQPERNNTASPYHITYEEYPNATYPRYCSGFGYLMNSKTKNAIVAEGLKDKHPLRFPDIYISGILPGRLSFYCDILPFSYHQGTADECIEMIKKNNKKEPSPSAPPLLACSTGRHVGQNSYSDYYKIWTDLRHVYADRLQSTNK